MQSDTVAGPSYLVTQARNGRWEVRLRGLDRKVASFPDRDGALEFAAHLAARARSAETATLH